MQDYWIQINDFPLYFIRKDGVVLSLKQREPRYMKPHLNGESGYYQISLSKGNKVYPALLHRLLAVAFIPNPNNYNIVNHKDGNKLNNNLDNLEWCSYSYNTSHAYDLGLLTSTVSKKVRCIETGIIYNTITEASKDTGANQSCISDVCKGKRKTAGKLHWEFYIEEVCRNDG